MQRLIWIIFRDFPYVNQQTYPLTLPEFPEEFKGGVKYRKTFSFTGFKTIPEIFLIVNV